MRVGVAVVARAPVPPSSRTLETSLFTRLSPRIFLITTNIIHHQVTTTRSLFGRTINSVPFYFGKQKLNNCQLPRTIRCYSLQ